MGLVQKTSTTPRIWEVDALRGLAALTVMVFHFAGPFYGGFPLATLGRQLLLVLSGYFATSILLRSKARISDPRLVLRSFYVRRWLRLYPVYAIIVVGFSIVMYFTGNPGFLRHDLIWHLLYLSNFLLYLNENWGSPAVPLWTLSAIEQFYLLWPWLVVLCRPALLSRLAHGVFWLGAASSVASQLWLSGPWKVLMPNNLPYLAAGAMVAIQTAGLARALQKGPREKSPLARYFSPAVVGGLVFFPAWIAAKQWPIFAPIADLGAAVVLAALTRAVVADPDRRDPGLFARCSAYVGQTGFLIYLTHGFVKQGVHRVLNHVDEWFPGMPSHEELQVLVNPTAVAVTLVFCAFLHELLEKPLMNLRPRSPQAAPVAPSAQPASGELMVREA